MMTDEVKDEWPGKRLYEEFLKLPRKDKFWLGYFVVFFTAIIGGAESAPSWVLPILLANLIFAYEKVRKNAVFEKLMNDNEYKEKNMDTMDKESLNGLFNGAILHDTQIVIAQSGSKVIYKEVASPKGEAPQVTDEQVASAIEKHQSLFWAQSAWAVVFCVCRDHLGMGDNMTMFERYLKGLPFSGRLTYECPEGTVQKALCNNQYMKLPIGKWKTNGGKERALLLAETLIAELAENKDFLK